LTRKVVGAFSCAFSCAAQWGFKGFVVTDFTGIPEMTLTVWAICAVSALALNAGVEIDMVGEGF
jgi:beta-glucosidase